LMWDLGPRILAILYAFWTMLFLTPICARLALVAVYLDSLIRSFTRINSPQPVQPIHIPSQFEFHAVLLHHDTIPAIRDDTMK